MRYAEIDMSTGRVRSDDGWCGVAEINYLTGEVRGFYQCDTFDKAISLVNMMDGYADEYYRIDGYVVKYYDGSVWGLTFTYNISKLRAAMRERAKRGELRWFSPSGSGNTLYAMSKYARMSKTINRIAKRNHRKTMGV